MAHTPTAPPHPLPSSTLPAPQLSRISQLHGLLSPSKPLEYLNRAEPNLEGLTPTTDLTLFREAQSRMKETLVSGGKVGVEG